MLQCWREFYERIWTLRKKMGLCNLKFNLVAPTHKKSYYSLSLIFSFSIRFNFILLCFWIVLKWHQTDVLRRKKYEMRFNSYTAFAAAARMLMINVLDSFNSRKGKNIQFLSSLFKATKKVSSPMHIEEWIHNDTLNHIGGNAFLLRTVNDTSRVE